MSHVARLHAGRRRGPGVLVARASVHGASPAPARRRGGSADGSAAVVVAAADRFSGGAPPPNRLDEQAARAVYLASETSGGRG